LYLDINNSAAEFCSVNVAGNYGIVALSVSDSTELNCYNGIIAYVANNCTGTGSASESVGASVANNCYGNSPAGVGVDCTIAVNCYGSSSTGVGISAFIANSCVSTTGDGNIANKYNMP
jgi:hypothetical protein